MQYAHARICSIMRKAAGRSGEDDADVDALALEIIAADTKLSLLTDDAELALMRKLSEFGEVVERAARDRAPFRLTHYAEELAATLHQFYSKCQVLSDDADITSARLALMDATRHTLANALRLVGISAPKKM